MGQGEMGKGERWKRTREKGRKGEKEKEKEKKTRAVGGLGGRLKAPVDVQWSD